MASNFAESASLNSPPSSPPASSVSTLGWDTKPDAGMGPEASNPQIKALQAIKMMEMAAQQLSTAVPEVGPTVQAFVQQLMTVVPQLMSQQMTGTPSMTSAPPMGA